MPEPAFWCACSAQPRRHDTCRCHDRGPTFLSYRRAPFAGQDSALCFEANPEIYNCRFITHTVDALALVGAVGMRGFDLQFDSGTYFANDESHVVDGVVLSAARHFHVSEPHLVPVGSSGVDHAQLGAKLLDSTYSGWVSVEMRQTDNWKQAIRNLSGFWKGTMARAWWLVFPMAKRLALIGNQAFQSSTFGEVC